MRAKDLPLIAFLGGALLFAAAGCKPTGNNSTGDAVSELTASTGGRDLHVSRNGGAWVNQQKNQFTVKVAGHEIVIDRERLLVDKKESVKVPADAKKFVATLAGGKLTMAADGVEILKTPLSW